MQIVSKYLVLLKTTISNHDRQPFWILISLMTGMLFVGSLSILITFNTYHQWYILNLHYMEVDLQKSYFFRSQRFVNVDRVAMYSHIFTDDIIICHTNIPQVLEHVCVTTSNL